MRQQPFEVGQRIRRKNSPGDRSPPAVFGGWDAEGRPIAVYIIRQTFPIHDLNEWEPVHEREGQHGLSWDTTTGNDYYTT